MREGSSTFLCAALPTTQSIRPGGKEKISFIILFLHRVKLLTTGNNTVRFNPNFYKTGKVILYSWFHEDFWFLSSTQTRQVITQWNTGLKVPRCACDMCHSILDSGHNIKL